MKYALFLIAFTLFFISCDLDENSVDIKNQNGIIKKTETSTWMYGTHTLNDANGGPIFALTSSTIDLSIYEDKRVNVSGYLVDGYPVDGGPKYLNVKTILIN